MKYFGSLSRGERGTGRGKKTNKKTQNWSLNIIVEFMFFFLLKKKIQLQTFITTRRQKKKVTFKNINRLSQNISTSPTCLQSKNGISRHVTWLALAGRYMFMVGRWLQHERWHRKIWLENQDTRGPRERGALFPSSGSTTNRLVL